MITWNLAHNNNQILFTTQFNQEILQYVHPFYWQGNHRFLNIQKNATTTMAFMMKRPLKNIEKPYYFTILRNPLERLKSTFYYNHVNKGWPVQDQGQELIEFKNIFNDYDWFCHFIPQHLHIKPFLENGIDIEYFSMDQVPYLCKKILTKMCHVPKHNNTKPSEKLIEQVLEWIDINQNFVDAFLDEDYKLFSSKIPKAIVLE